MNKVKKIEVLKFGGSSLGSIFLIRNVAKKIKNYLKKGTLPVVVVSAMGDTTDTLFESAYKLSKHPPEREMDMLLTAGERISMALLAIALREENIPAVSFTGSQIGLITDTKHTRANIIEIRGERLIRTIRENKVPIIAGFQGISVSKEITTLGRGGSDLTAVALASFLNLKEVKIFTDVDGVFSADPKVLKNPKRIKELSYEEMLEFSKSGAKVMHHRAVCLAAKEKIKINVLSSFNSRGGTMIFDKKFLEKKEVKGISIDQENLLWTLCDVKVQKGKVFQVITYLIKNGIEVKLFFHGISEQNKMDLSFVFPHSQRKKVEIFFKELKKSISYRKIVKEKDISLLSLIGYGIGSDSEILENALRVFERKKAHILGMLPSETRIVFVMLKKDIKKVFENLSNEFNLKTID